MSTLPIFEFATAKNLKQALSALGPGWTDSVAYAGGVDLLDLMKERLTEPKRLVNIKQAGELKYIRSEADGSIRIGPLVTLAEIAAHDELARAFPAFARACGKAATPQVRNLATIGGNLCQRPRCWYFRREEFPCLRKGGGKCFAREGENRYHAIFTEGEPCVIVNASTPAVALVALDARLRISSASGEKTIPVAKFFVRPKDNVHRETILMPSELITEIILPGEARAMRQAYLKLREKQSYDWPMAECAAAALLDGTTVREIRIVLGAAAPVPRRAEEAEKFVTGKPLTEETARKAGELAVAGAAPLSQNGYKMQLFPVLVRRTLQELAGLRGRSVRYVESA